VVLETSFGWMDVAGESRLWNIPVVARHTPLTGGCHWDTEMRPLTGQGSFCQSAVRGWAHWLLLAHSPPCSLPREPSWHTWLYASMVIAPH
jgi:hypothetical protein